MLASLARIIFRNKWLVLVSATVFLAVAIATLLRGGRLSSGTIRGLEADKTETFVAEVLGHPADTTFVAIFRHPEIDSRYEAFEVEMQRAVAPLRTDPAVLEVLTPRDAPPFRVQSMVNGPAHASVALITLKGDFAEALRAYPSVRERLRSDLLEIKCTGHVPYMFDLNHTLERDLFHAELYSLPLALLVLLIVFRTATAAVLPVGVGGLSVASGIAVVFALSHHVDIAQYTINVCSLIGLGVAIDYSLFTVSRYREELAAGRDYENALVRAVETSGRMVLFSGLAVATGLGGLFFFRGSYLFAMGIGGCIVVVFAVIFALTFLPALLAVLGPKIHAGRLPLPRFGPREGFWHGMATWVMRHPIITLVPTLAVLLCMGVPFLHLRMAAADVRVLTESVEARQGYDRLRADFADLAETRITVALRFPSVPTLNAERIGALYDLSRRIAELPHVAKVESLVDGDQPLDKEDYLTVLLDPPDMYKSLIESAKKVTVGDRTILLYVLTKSAPDSEEARAIVRALRRDRAVADGTMFVGGQTANDIDATEFLVSRTPKAIGFVVGVTVVVLFLLLGSVVLPLKAIAMNFLSIAGSFGALVWVFQDGHIFIHEPRPIEPTLPVLLFCILFGLSMDYEVLMLSRIKESYDRTGDNTGAVAEGLEQTAGLITGAAAIMIAVFGAFSLAAVILLKAVGFGMALAVALDATLVRILLVPATMRLFGDANWWAPQWMLAIRKRVLMGHETHH